MQKRVVLMGAGGTGREYSCELLKKGEVKIVAFLDNSKAKQGTKINGIEVYAPAEVSNMHYDEVVVVAPGLETDIVKQLLSLGVPEDKITIYKNSGQIHIETRNTWLADFAKTVHMRGLSGNVAEAGVFRGDFAMKINGAFPGRTLYLFDTFEGFPEEDVEKEQMKSNSKAGYYDFTSEELVLSKLPHPEKAVVKKGYFPQTAEGVEDRFCFVNLDLDLYQPTFEGLKFFYGKMERGGVILVHDYFGIDFPNVKTAVHDFEKWLGEPLKMIPIGDTLSMAILK